MATPPRPLGPLPFRSIFSHNSNLAVEKGKRETAASGGNPIASAASMKPKPPVHFGLREQLIKQTYGVDTSSTTETESSLRTGPAAIAKGASVAAVALMNMALLVGPGEAQAQAPETAPATKKKPATTNTTAATTEMPEVVVVGQSTSPYNPQRISSPLYTEPLRDVPQTITVVPQAVIEQQNATTLRDVLRNVPGISMQAGEGGGGPGGDFLSIRGFNARNDIFIDGVRDFGGYTRDPFNFEQVEVIKGPASSYTGRGSTGGSINLSSKHAGLERSFYNANLGLGTDEYKRGTLDINQVLTPLWHSSATPDSLVDPKDPKNVVTPAPSSPDFQAALRLNAMWHENEVANRDFVEQQRWGIAPTLTLGFGENTRIMLSYFHMEQDNQPDYGIPWVPTTQSVLGKKYWNKPSPVNFSNYYGLLERDKEETTTDIGTIELEQKFTEWFSLRNTVRYGETHRDSIITAPRYLTGVTDPDVVINRQFQSRDQTDKIFSEQFDMRFSFDTWGIKHETVAGFDLTREESENRLRATTGVSVANLYHPDATDNWSGDINYTGAVNESITNNAGLFLFETMKFWEDKIQLSGGVRWDYYEAELDQKDAAGVLTEFDRTDKVWSYRVALAYKPVEIGTIYAAYGTSFNPSAEGAVSLSPLNEATAALEPEENRTIEIGTKWELLDKKLSVTAAVFQTDKTNARVPGVDPGDPPTILGGKQRVRGFEIGVAGSITDDWKVFGGYTYLDSEVRKTTETYTDVDGNIHSREGNELPQTPEHSFSLWTTYALPWDIEIGTGVSYVGSRFSATDNLREAPDYWLWDAMISKQITKNIKAQINVYNLADEEYIDRVGGGHFVPGAGRTGVLTVGFNF